MRPRIYALWFFAAALVGAIGSASDVSWHFSRLFDEVSPPHLIAAGGFLINLALIYWALVHECVTGVERTGWRLNALGAAVFVFAIPLDYLWHLLFGLDNTVWSPPHLLLFYSAAPITLGVLLAWLTRPTSRTRPGQALTFLPNGFILGLGHQPSVLARQLFDALLLALARSDAFDRERQRM